MKDVGYFAPSEIGETLKLLADYGAQATVLAGGTDLVPKINCYELKPENLLYIGRLGLDYIKEKDGKLVLGAATSTAQIAANELVQKKATALAQAAYRSGGAATKTIATVGGNVANASPGADLACALLAMDAEIALASVRGTRSVAIKDFFTGRGETVRRPDELLLEIHIPIPKGKTVFWKLGRRKAKTLSVANTSVHLLMDGKKCVEARIALGAMAPTLLRCTQAEALIKGQTLDITAAEECAARAVADSAPIDDQRASAWYRKKAGQALVVCALAQAADINN
ncbi:MAG: xanthine dehydrogenase family protein subunit M [Desulfobacterales bacterium]|nr:MAG: xanthine dehydrogenase family protein subunit M [Desulfobacterales bacterium]